MAFNRVVELSVGKNPPSDGVVLDNLHIDFRVTRTVTFSGNTAEISIYNSAETTRNDFIVKGNNVILKAGYEDETVGIIFVGQVDRVTTMKKGATLETKINATSTRAENKPLEQVIIATSYAADTPVSAVISEIANALGLAVFGIENATGIKMTNGFTDAAKAKDVLYKARNILKTQDVDLFIDNNQLVIYKLKGRSSIFQAAYLDDTCGLLSFGPLEENRDEDAEKVSTKKKIQFECLLNHAIKPNSVVTLKTVDGTNSYLIDSVEFSGNNYGGDFKCTCEAAIE